MNKMFNTHRILTERKLFLLHESRIFIAFKTSVCSNWKVKGKRTTEVIYLKVLFLSASNCLCQTISKRNNELIIVQNSKAFHSCLPFSINVGAWTVILPYRYWWHIGTLFLYAKLNFSLCTVKLLLFIFRMCNFLFRRLKFLKK